MNPHIIQIIDLLNFWAAESIFQRNLHEWGDRDIYPTTKEELPILIKGGAWVKKFNYKLHDNTYIHEVTYNQKKFLLSTARSIRSF